MKFTAKEVREKYIKFFSSTPRNHAEIEPAPLVLENDPSTLFTSAGMQPLVPYLMGEPHTKGARLVNSQPSIRLGDIEEVGDNRHTTFFEMLGNWSLGDYFKAEQLPWIFEFFTKELGISKDKLWVSVFEGDDQVPKDTESFEIWKKIGIAEERIVYYPAKKNWWSMTGTPAEMQVGHIGGPDSEVFYDFGEEHHVHENSAFKNEECHPNCDCGRFLEIGNSVFIQYKKVSDTKLEELPDKNVDFGGGLERITAAVNNTPDVFKTDLFKSVLEASETMCGAKYGENKEKDKEFRIIADHLRASYMLISNNVLPSNKTQGYVLRRLIRRAVLSAKKLSNKDNVYLPVVDFSKFGIPIKLKSKDEINQILKEETEKFFKALKEGIPQTERISKKITQKADEIIEENLQSFGVSKFQLLKDNNIQTISNTDAASGTVVYNSLATYGLPMEVSLPVIKQNVPNINETEVKNYAEVLFNLHKEQSRTTSAGVFKGGLADTSDEVVKLHTATHLLLATLRKVLGEHVVQKGQNITRERSRFDFPHPQKLTDEEVGKIEDSINDVIKKDLPVNFSILPKDEALATGAIHAFNEKYADTVKVYYVGESLDSAYSKEFCGGPHVAHTGEIGHVRIKKQEKIGLGLNRIYLVIEPS